MRTMTSYQAGCRPFPPVMNLYGNFSRIVDALTTFKICVADRSDLLYIRHHAAAFGRRYEPRELLAEILYAGTNSSDHSVSFRFSVEVGIKMVQREEFEWRKPSKEVDTTNDTANKPTRHTPFLLFLLPATSSSSSTESKNEALAELVLSHMGDRWTLMVVVTVLRVYWLRAYGKASKAVIGNAEKIRGK
ncbi:hypothetical protein QBC36DRAFT_349151 [Triangularia setosa]|uniref:Uncharacterized protein n=1 Tax=Triangularia setosa TaxID=2587417 RepID=A0AAN6W055_9PEZI|nr:hypothetical protein QBC36DRAFT_349151 [Podospora setosa]